VTLAEVSHRVSVTLRLTASAKVESQSLSGVCVIVCVFVCARVSH